MAKRTFKSFTITAGGTPQPLVGTLTTSALVPTAAPQSIPVSDTSMFRKNDNMWLDQGASAEKIQVLKVIDTTHIQGIVTLVHATSAMVALSINFTNLLVQPLVGNGNLVTIFYSDRQYTSAQVVSNTTGLINAIKQLEPVTSPAQPNEFNVQNQFGSNPDDLAFYQIDGTTGQSYLPSIDIT